MTDESPRTVTHAKGDRSTMTRIRQIATLGLVALLAAALIGWRAGVFAGPALESAAPAVTIHDEPQTGDTPKEQETPKAEDATAADEEEPAPRVVRKSDREWRRQLTDMQYFVTRRKGTEQAFTGEFWNFHGDGVYLCVCCGNPLFDSRTKFESGTGWPSYYAAIDKTSIRTATDRSSFMVRTEVMCRDCNAHLGHVFRDGPRPTGLRFCMNSASLHFLPRAEYEAQQARLKAEAEAEAKAKAEAEAAKADEPASEPAAEDAADAETGAEEPGRD